MGSKFRLQVYNIQLTRKWNFFQEFMSGFVKIRKQVSRLLKI